MKRKKQTGGMVRAVLSMVLTLPVAGFSLALLPGCQVEQTSTMEEGDAGLMKLSLSHKQRLFSEMPPPEVLDAAEVGLTRFMAILEHADPGASPLGDQHSLDELRRAELGFGFQVFTITPQAIQSSKERSVARLISATGVWRFMVMIDGTARALLTIDRNNDGAYEAVSIGAAELSAQLSAVPQLWSADEKHACRFVRIYQGYSDFVEVSRKGQVLGYMPLSSAKEALRLRSSGSTPRSKELLSEEEIYKTSRDMMHKNHRLPSGGAQ